MVQSRKRKGYFEMEMKKYDNMSAVQKKNFEGDWDAFKERKQKYFELAQKKAGNVGSVVKILNDYVHVYDLAFESVRKDVKDLRSTYKETSQVYLEKYESRIVSFNDLVNAEKQEAIEKIKMSIGEALKKLNEFMREPISEDARNDIEMIKLLGAGSFSELEIETLLEKHQANYLATKVICKLTNASDLGIRFLSADDLKKELEKVQTNAVDFCNQYNGVPSYNFLIMLEGSGVDALNSNYESFVANWYDSKKE